MHLPRRPFLGFGAAAIASAALVQTARSQSSTYPTRPIKIVVPFPAGGPTDLMARLAGQALSSSFGQNVVVENLPGAGGTIGSQAVARANPDGYTLLLGGTNSNAISPAFYKALNYDPVNDFAPVAAVAVDSSALVVTPPVPAKTIQQLIQFLKANPGRLACGAPVGVAPHVMVVSFMVESSTDMVFVPYKGGAPVINDLLGGHIQLTIGAKSAFLPHIQAGKLRALAVTSEVRWRELPDVPTMRESGFANFPTYQRFDVLAPAKTPPAIIDKLNAAINVGLQSEELRTSVSKFGVETKLLTPQQLQSILLTEAQQWGAIVRSTGIKID